MPHDARVTTKATLPNELNSSTSISEIIAPRIRGYRRSKPKAGIISAFSVAALAVFGTRSVEAQTAPNYTLTDLGSLGGTTEGTGINNAQQITGISVTSAGQRAFLYTNGTMFNLGTLGGTVSYGAAINSSGVVTGWAYQQGGSGLSYNAFVDTNGSMTQLGAGAGTMGNGINSNGQVTGNLEVSVNGSTQAELILNSDGTVARDWPTYSDGRGYSGTGYSLNDSDEVTGLFYTNEGTGPYHAFLYSNGNMVDLGTFGGTLSNGLSINESGQVTGWANTSANNANAFLYSGDAITDLGTLGGAGSAGLSINASGEIVGWAITASGAHDAFLYSNGVMYDLNTLDQTSFLATYVALTNGDAINDNGDIVADGVDSRTGVTHAYLLTPVAGPSSGLQKALGDPQCACGDPINPATGNVFEKITDYASASSGGVEVNKITFERYYNSMAVTANPQSLAKREGTGWSDNFSAYLNITSSGGTITSISAGRPDGQALNFTPNGSGGYTSDTDVDVTLTQTGSTFTLTDHKNTVETYTELGSGEALLTSIKARDGYTQTLTYNGSNQLTGVTDSYSRSLTLTYYSNGLLDTVTTPGGLVMTYAYSSSGTNGATLDQLASVTYSGNGMTPATKTYTYGDSSFPFALTSITDENNHVSNTWTYDNHGRGTSSQRATVGSQQVDLTTIAYNSNGTVTVTNPLGEQTTYTFTILQNVPKVTQVSREPNNTVPEATRTFSYDANGYQNSVTDWNGNETDYVNDSHGDPTSITEASGTSIARTTTYAYDDESFPQLPTTITEPTRETMLTYDGSGNVLTRTVTDTTATPNVSRTWTYTYNGTGETLTIKGPRTDVNQTTTMTYDGAGNLATLADPLNHTTRFTSYDADGRLKSMTDPNGLITATTYDARGNMLTQTVGSEVTTLTRDAAENITKVTKPDGSSLTYTLDAANRVTKVTDSLGEAINYTLDAMGDHTAVNVYDASSTLTRTHTYTFDALGRIYADFGASNQEIDHYYDMNGNPNEIDTPTAVTTFAFDALNRKTQIVDDQNHVTTIIYSPDTRNLVSQVTSPRGVVTQYTYDGFGDRLNTGSQDSGLTTNTYDLAGNVATSEDANGNTTTMTYDADNRIKTATHQDGSVTDYYYDSETNGVGHIKSIYDSSPATSPANYTFFGYDIYGHVTWKQNYLTSQNYYASYNATTGQLTNETYPSGMVVGYQYDAAGQTKEVDINSTPFIAHVTHEPFGPANSWIWYAAWTTITRTYDLDGRLASYPLGTADTRTLTYDADSRVTNIDDSAAPADDQVISYDDLDRITSYTGPFGNGNQSETYDADGNRTGITTAAGAETDAIDATSNRLVSRTLNGNVTNFATDAAGNVTSTGSATYTYDARERQATETEGGTTVSSYYNGVGERVQKNSSTAGLRRYFWAPAGKELTSPRELGAYYLYNGATSSYQETIYLDGALPIGVTATGGTGVTGTNTIRAYADNQGAIRLLTDQGNNAYGTWNSDAFGLGVANYNPAGHGTVYLDLRFPGQSANDLADTEDGTYWNMARTYSPTLGRYLQSDPIGLNGGDLVTYNYARNNPANLMDPTGQGPELFWPVVSGLVIVGLIQQFETYAYFESPPEPVQPPKPPQPANSCTVADPYGLGQTKPELDQPEPPEMPERPEIPQWTGTAPYYPAPR